MFPLLVDNQLKTVLIIVFLFNRQYIVFLYQEGQALGRDGVYCVNNLNC